MSVPNSLNQLGDAIFRLPLRYATPSAALAVLAVVVASVDLERRVRVRAERANQSGVEVVA